MSFWEESLGSVAAFCVGTAAVALGAPPTGAIEATVGAAGLIGFILGRAQKFGPECHRVRGRIQNEVLKNYQHLISGSDGSFDAAAELTAANEALKEALGQCTLDRKALAASAVTPAGFPSQAVTVIISALGEVRPELFGKEQSGTLAYRFARDVIHAGIEAAIADVNYYRQIEPFLMFEMAGAIGSIQDSTARIELLIANLKRDIAGLTEAKQSSNIMENFIRDFAYEIRLPVANIIGFMELASIASITEEKRQQYYSPAHSASVDLVKIIDEALTMGKPDTVSS